MGCPDEAHLRLVGRQFKGHPHGHRVARGLQYVFKAPAAGQRLGFFHKAFLQGVHGLVRAHPLCQLQPAVVNVKGHNLLCAQDFCPLQGKDADGAAAQDRHGFAAPVPGLEQAVHRHCGRLKHGRLLIGNRRIIFDSVCRRDHHIFREASLLPAADKAVMPAQGEVSLLAVRAFHAGHQRRAAHRVANLQAFHAFADLHHVSAEFVSKHHRIEVRPVVQYPRHVAAADTGCPHPDLYRPGPAHRRLPVRIADILISVQHRCFHSPVFLPFTGCPVMRSSDLSDSRTASGRFHIPGHRFPSPRDPVHRSGSPGSSVGPPLRSPAIRPFRPRPASPRRE